MANVSISPVLPCQTSTSDLDGHMISEVSLLHPSPSLPPSISISLSLSLSASVCLCHFLVDVTLYFLDRKKITNAKLVTPHCTLDMHQSHA